MHNSGFNSQKQLTPVELRKRARLLKEGNYFLGTSNSDPLWEKQLIFLVLAGLKPVSEVYSGHWIDTPTGQEVIGDDLAEVRHFLNTLDLAHHVLDTDGITMAVVARTSQLVQEYMNAKDERTRGLLFGYPETAVETFESGETLSLKQQREFLQAEALADAPYALSCQYWREELAVLCHWHDVLEAYGLSEGEDQVRMS